MSRKIRRDPGGQFAAGQSGNPDGARLRKPRPLLTTTDLHRITLEVAGETAGLRDGKPVTRYENAIRSLLKGDSTNRLATRDFVEEAKSASYHFDGLARKEELARKAERARKAAGGYAL